VYHGDPAGDGVAGPGPSLAHPVRRWTSPDLGGQLYGEPLLEGDLVVVATTADTVVGLSAADGTVRWTAHLGSPVPSSRLPCGDISPTVGVVGTPVIDPARDEVFAVADELHDGRPAHHLVGVALASGRVLLDQDVDPPGSDPAALLQRTGLTLTGGRVAFALGGNYGDCGDYHGWAVSVPEGGGPAADFEVDAAPGQRQGAIWMGGAAPVVGADGNVWVETGNGSVTDASAPFDGSDAVTELSPTMARLQFFAPTTWAADNAADLDLSTAPVLLADGLALGAGKNGRVYLLSQTHLGGVGGQLAVTAPVCDGPIDGGAAVVGTTVVLPCQSGLVAVSVQRTPPRVTVAWHAPGPDSGPPIVAGGLVWTLTPSGVLAGLDPTTGRALVRVPLGAGEANHFPTPSAAGGLLLAPTATTVVALAASGAPGASSTTTSGGPTTTSRPPSTGAVRASAPLHQVAGGPGAGPIVVFVLLGLALLAGAVLLVRRARRRRTGREPV
jgi:outer membrane protein assembly factor BamB